MNKLCAVAYSILLATPWVLFAGSQPESSLGKKISLHLLAPLPANALLLLVAGKCGLTVEYADEAVRTNNVAFKLMTRDVKAECIVDWALRTLNAHATITGNVMSVAAGAPPPLPSRQPSSNAPSLLYGHVPWTNSLTMRADQAIDYLMYIGDWRNYVMIPECDELRTFVTITPKERSIVELLDDVCSQVGLACSLRGEVLYVQRMTAGREQ